MHRNISPCHFCRDGLNIVRKSQVQRLGFSLRSESQLQLVETAFLLVLDVFDKRRQEGKRGRADRNQRPSQPSEIIRQRTRRRLVGAEELTRLIVRLAIVADPNRAIVVCIETVNNAVWSRMLRTVS